MKSIYSLLIFSALAILLSSCDGSPGRPKQSAEIARPQDQLDFGVLYKANCAGCHGANGENGAAIDLSNPEYQSLVDDESLKKWITAGLPGTEMPAFGASAGGSLTVEQIDSLIQGMRKNWSQSGPASDQEVVESQNPSRPSYLQAELGDANRGKQLYATVCTSCHLPSNQQITNPSYLALVSDQALRSILIAGRPDIGQPDWRLGGTGTPLSSRDVTDLVSYLASLRSATPGQPYPQHP